MTAQTYGEHQESAAAALNLLITSEAMPTDPVDIETVMHCREIVIDAVRQRLYTLGLNTHYPATLVPARLENPRLTSVNKHLATLLDRTAFEVPTLPPDRRLPASDILRRRSADLSVRLWQQAAVELLAGSHALDAAEQRPWLHDQGPAWWLMRDAAVTMEAALVLDGRFEEIGLLSGHSHPESTLGLEEHRMVASQCARVATWHATSDAADAAAPSAPADRVVAGPTYIISGPTDLAAAQRQLARHLRPMHANSVSFTGEPEIDSGTARMVIASQVFLTRTFENLAQQIGAEAVRQELASRHEVLVEVQARMSYLIDASPVRCPNHLPIAWQQSELTTAVRRMQRTGGGLLLSAAQLQDLAAATHETTHNAGKAMRRELLRDASNLRIEDPTGQVGRTRVHRYHPLERSLTDLVHIPPPSAPVATYSSPLQRAALRATLDVTPTAHRAPSPYPAARGVAPSDCSI